MRQWFAAEGFVEVETPILQVAPGAEVHLAGFATDWKTPDGEERERWLHSSPEFAMKKLLAGGVPRLFQFARVFRNAEGSALHHPEFTMLEWYRAGAGYETIMKDCAALLALAGAKELRWGTCLRSRGGARAADRGRGVPSATPASTCWRRSAAPRSSRMPRAWRCMPATPGTTSSSASCSTGSSTGSAWAGRRSCASTRSRWRRWPAPSPAIRGSPSASSSMPAASSSPTPSASSPIPPSSARACRPTWTRRNGSTACAGRSTRISSPPSTTACRIAPASRWASTAWSCWRPAPAHRGRAVATGALKRSR